MSYFLLKDFGAIGDGVTDDTLSVQAALKAAYDNGVKYVYGESNAVYKLHRVAPYSNVTLDFRGATVISGGDASLNIAFAQIISNYDNCPENPIARTDFRMYIPTHPSRYTGGAYDLSGDFIRLGTSKLTLINASDSDNFTSGDKVVIVTGINSNKRIAELNKIRQSASGVITLEWALTKNHYRVGAGPFVIAKLDDGAAVERFVVRNAVFEHNLENVTDIDIRLAYHCTVEDCVFKDNGAHSYMRGHGNTHRRLTVYPSSANRWSIAFDQGSSNGKVEDCTLYFGKRATGFHFGENHSNMKFRNNFVCWDIPESIDNVTTVDYTVSTGSVGRVYEGNTFINPAGCFIGMRFRDEYNNDGDLKAVNNNFLGVFGGRCIDLTSTAVGPGSVQITGNTFRGELSQYAIDHSKSAGDLMRLAMGQVTDNFFNVKFPDGTVNKINSSLISGGGTHSDKLIIKDNIGIPDIT